MYNNLLLISAYFEVSQGTDATSRIFHKTEQSIVKNGKYVLNYQHVCFEAPGCASPYASFTFIPVSVFITGQREKHKVKYMTERKEPLQPAAQTI